MRRIVQMDGKQIKQLNQSQISRNVLKLHTAYIKRRLRKLGAVQYDLMLPETNVLPLVVHPDEVVEGIVYGKYRQDSVPPVSGRGLMVATDMRILLVDRKPFYMKCNEISYAVISAVSYSRVGAAGTVVLHTRLGNISIRTFNEDCAQNFVQAIESRIFSYQEQIYD